MRVPILQQGEYLIASIQEDLADEDLEQLRHELLHRIGQARTRGVLIDVTIVDVMDSYATRTLRDLARMVKLRGAETLIVGIQPEVAFAMVRLGLSFEGVETALDLEDGLTRLAQLVRRRQPRGR